MAEELYFPCPVCKGTCKIKEDKNKKPYISCDPCNLRMFVRGEEGIRKMIEISDKLGVA